MTTDVIIKYQRRVRTPRLACFLLALLSACQVLGIETVAIVYPQLRPPFSHVYRDIIEGIDAGFTGTIRPVPINGSFDPPSQITANGNGGPDAYIALGGKSLAALGGIDKPVFAAVSEAVPVGKIAGTLILRPTARTYLSRLLDIYPAAGMVHVVYDREEHEPLISDASNFVAEHDLELNAVGVSGVREAAQAFRRIMQDAASGDVIWLIPDGGLIDSALLNAILDSAWDRRFAVFSSNPAFVKRGALFAIYPDNVGVGRRLGNLVNDFSGGTAGPGRIEYLEDVKVAFNERTGNHLGIKLTSSFRDKVDLILPQ